MRLVIDANVLVSAFLRDGLTRELLFHAPIECYAPEWIVDEFNRNVDLLCARSSMSQASALALRDRILADVQLVPAALFDRHAAEASARCVESGPKDAPYVACALAVDASLWTHDQVLATEAGVPVVSTAQLAESFLSK